MDDVTRYQVELPLPPKACSPNWRGCWQAKHRAQANYRRECFRRLSEAFPRPFPGDFLCFDGVTVSYEFWQGKPHPDGRARFRDADNAIAAMKAAQDALMDACIIPCDSTKLLGIGLVTLHPRAQSDGRACVVMTLEARA